jgi:amino acid adenylation domain-containing protein
VEPGDRVAVLARRSIETVAAVLGVLRARAVWVPIDPKYPSTRIDWMASDSDARLLLTDEPARSGAAADLPVLSIDEVIDATEEGPSAVGDPHPEDLAYLIYTSGSTGRPKGVQVEHRGLIGYLDWASRQYVRGDRLSFGLFTSLSFDLTITSLFLPLITGGVLEVYPEPDNAADSALLDLIRENAVDFVKLTPSHLSLLRQANLEGTRIRRMVVGGEDLKVALAEAISAQIGGSLELYNEYGPTEAVVGCTVHRYRPDHDLGERVPIGGPADDVLLRVLSDEFVAVPEGVPGELWIARRGLARGYHGLCEETESRFRDDPGGSGRRMYRTGDRVRFTEARGLEFLGRLDRQLKIAGHRIEPGEVESALLEIGGIEQAVVLPIQEGPAVSGRPEEVDYCTSCGLPSDYPLAGRDASGVCSLCRAYEAAGVEVAGYFGSMKELEEIFEESRRQHTSEYDCLLLLSGGKDSTYALCKLVEMGLSVYAFTLDNGFISDSAKENMQRVTEALGVPLEIATTPAMNAIFRDSLTRFSNVCHGCFKTIYTLSLNRAEKLGIPIIVTGLSRGQMFETRLTPEMFRDGRRTAEEVDAAVLAARKIYHRVDDEVARSLDVRIFEDDRIFETVRFVDFYRYCDADLTEILAHLERSVPWVRPPDTGRSTNCLINDAGIYVHRKERGFHNYALPYSWDVRLGQKTRDQALEELDDELDVASVRAMLDEIGYVEKRAEPGVGGATLAAFFTSAEDLPIADLRRRLAETLPSPLVPTLLRRVESVPLTESGKIDEASLARRVSPGSGGEPGAPPMGPVEEFLANLWREQLHCEVDREADFFALGGTSLGAMELMLRLCREFDVELPLDAPFKAPILRELAAEAEERILGDVSEMSEDEVQRLMRLSTASE